MRRDIASRLSCPACSSDLQLEIWREDREEVDEGVFRCGCGEWFPVLRGIPRMLVSPHREALLEQESEFTARRGSLLPAWKPLEPEGHERVQRSTAESFGAQWKTFREMRSHYEQLFHSYFDEIDVKRYRSRPVLDAGCGMGRWAVFWAAAGAEVFAVDLGSAIESAAANLRGYPGAHVIQADLLRLPFPKNSFDAVYSMGVLHHLPDPAAGFRAIAAQVAPAGELGIYLYYSLEKPQRRAPGAPARHVADAPGHGEAAIRGPEGARTFAGGRLHRLTDMAGASPSESRASEGRSRHTSLSVRASRFPNPEHGHGGQIRRAPRTPFLARRNFGALRRCRIRGAQNPERVPVLARLGAKAPGSGPPFQKLAPTRGQRGKWSEDRSWVSRDRLVTAASAGRR